VREHLLGLFEIQRIDVVIHELQEKREGIPVKLSQLQADISSRKDEVSSMKEQSESYSKEASNLEGVLQAENLKLKKWDVRLKEIRNQREFQALSREIESSKRANQNTEERILELWKTKEALDVDIEEKKNTLVELETSYQEQFEEIKAELGEIESAIAAETARRDVLQPNIPTALWRRYVRIRDKRKGQGLVLANGGSCQGCNMKLLPQLYIILQRGESVEECPACNRILLFEGFLPAEDNEETSVGVSA
tara:strand:+ start:159 stop:911 length:753 start_codon:yes stop_codon:yes gene_type:complete